MTISLLLRAHGLLAAILLTGFILRFAGIFWGVPFFDQFQSYFHPDEIKIILDLSRFPAFLLAPGDLRYPTLFHALIGSFVFCTKPIVHALGGDAWVYTYMAGRLFSVFLGTATLYLTYRLGRIVFDKTAGLLAAFVLALSPGHIQSSSWATVDITTTFLFTGFLIAVYRATYDRRSFGSYVWAGTLLRLAAGAKYTAAIGAVYLLTLHMLHALEAAPSGKKTSQLLRSFADGRLVAAGIVSIVILIATTPGIVLQFEDFLNSIRFELARMDYGRPAQARENFFYAAAVTLNACVECLGLTVVLAMVSIGSFLLRFHVKHHPLERAGMILVLVFLAYFNSALMGRYVLLIAPLVSVLALQPLMLQFLRSKEGICILVMIAMAMAYIGIRPVIVRHQDSRILAARYIATHIPEGTTIGAYPGYHAPRIDEKKYNIISHFPYDNAAYMIWTHHVEEIATRSDVYFGFRGAKAPPEEERSFHRKLADMELPEYELMATFGGEALPLHFSSPAIGIFRKKQTIE